MNDPAIQIQQLSKCYKLGAIGRHTLVDEVTHLWHKVRGRDPRQHMGKLGYSATEARRMASEEQGAREFWALRDVSFDVQMGEVVGIIGRNGAGKSTLLKLLTRITGPTSGEAIINGRVGSLLEVGTGFHPELTGRENVFMNGAILGMKKWEIESKFDEIVAFSEIEKFIDTPVKRYSSGMYVRLAFAVAAHLDPEILLVDEVLAVGDVAFQKKCLGKMGEAAHAGRTVLFVSHNMPAIQNLCSRVIVIDQGRTVMNDVPEKAIAHYIETCGGHRGHEFHRDAASIPDGAELVVESARIETLSGESVGSMPMGDGFAVRMRVAARTAVTNFIAAVSVADSMGTRLSGINSRDVGGHMFSLQAGERIGLVCRIPRFNLMPGVYYLNLGVQRAVSREPLDYVGSALSFEVLPHDVYGTGKIPRGPGFIFLESEWKSEDLPEFSRCPAEHTEG